MGGGGWWMALGGRGRRRELVLAAGLSGHLLGHAATSTHGRHEPVGFPGQSSAACRLIRARVWCRTQVGEAEKELGGAAATNPFAQLVDEAEGLDKIEDLQVGGSWSQLVPQLGLSTRQLCMREGEGKGRALGQRCCFGCWPFLSGGQAKPPHAASEACCVAPAVHPAL